MDCRGRHLDSILPRKLRGMKIRTYVHSVRTSLYNITLVKLHMLVGLKCQEVGSRIRPMARLLLSRV